MNTLLGPQLYEVWAPPESVWSRWAKPALFAELNAATFSSLGADAPPAGEELEPVQPPPDFQVDVWTAFIVDVPGARAVEIGMAMARAGYRPVPLFNTAYHPFAIVPVNEIVRRLQEGAAELSGLPIAPDSPPSFLLDSNRLDPKAPATPGRFDNRWAVFPQDFPSATFLRSRGIRRVVVLQAELLQGKPRLDLSHVLLRWKEAGLELYVQDPEGTQSPRPMEVERPSAFRSLFHRALTAGGLRRNSAGGFGSIIPQPSQSSGRSGFG